MRRSLKRPQGIAELVSQYLAKGEELPQRQNAHRVLKICEAFESLGGSIADQAQVTRFRSGVLYLDVGQGPWLTELSLLKPQLIKRLNQSLPKPWVKDIRLKLGRLRPKKTDTQPLPPLDQQQIQTVEALGAEIRNHRVRNAVMSAAAKSLALGPAKGPLPGGPAGPVVSVSPLESEVAAREEKKLSYGYGNRSFDRWKMKSSTATDGDS